MMELTTPPLLNGVFLMCHTLDAWLENFYEILILTHQVYGHMLWTIYNQEEYSKLYMLPMGLGYPVPDCK